MWIRVGAHSVPGELAIDTRTARLRVLVFLQHQDPGALAQHEAVAVDVPRPARAVAGSSLRVDSALTTQNPPTPSALTVDSVPPAIITSASPYSINRPASPRLWFAVEHALTMARFGPP